MIDWEEEASRAIWAFVTVFIVCMAVLVVAAVAYVVLGIAGFIPDFGDDFHLEGNQHD